MIDYSKLQIETIKNLLCKGKSATNKFCYTDNGILLTDSVGTMAVLIPNDKFFLDTSKFVFNELKGLKENVILGKLIPAGTGARQYSDIEIMLDKEFMTDEPSEVLEEEFIDNEDIKEEAKEIEEINEEVTE